MSTSQTKSGIFGVPSTWRPWPKKRTALAVRVSALFLLVILSLVSAVRTAPPGLPLDIDVLGTDSGKKSMLFAEGGGELSIELSTDRALGILTYNGTTPYPDTPLPINQIDSIKSYAAGILLFSNPDGVAPDPNPFPLIPPESYCLSFLNFYFGDGDLVADRTDLLNKFNHSGCPVLPPPTDEKHLYFAIGTDIGAEQISTTPPAVGEPWPPAGRSPRIPGLVILSDSGIGNFYVQDGGSYFLASPRKARNLAAYINSVGFMLRNYQRKSVVTASWIAPKGIVTPYIERDSDIGPSCSSSGTNQTALRINGSEDIQYVYLDSPSSPLDSAVQELAFKLRIFVVDGPAPQELTDKNNDGEVDSQDAVIDMYTLLSEEKTIYVRIATWDFFGNATVDLDGNGCVGPGVVSPAGAGGLGRIPQ